MRLACPARSSSLCHYLAIADFLDTKKQEIEARLKELRPLVEEYHRLEAAVTALDGASPAATPTKPARRGPAKRTSASPAKRGTGRRGRPKGSGKRGQQVLDLITARPGITIPELSKEIGIQPNYLYRVVPDLQKQGKVVKRGRGWHAK